MTQTATRPMNLLPAEKIIVTALQALAGVCDFATTHDNQGYNGVDAHFGHDLAEKAMYRRLTPRQLLAARKMLNKYRVQLSGFGITLPTPEEMQSMIFEIEHPFDGWCRRVLPEVEALAQHHVNAAERVAMTIPALRQYTVLCGHTAFDAWQQTYEAQWQPITDEQIKAWAKTYANTFFDAYRVKIGC